MKEALVLLPGLLNDAALFVPQMTALGDVAGPVMVADLTRHDSVAAMAEATLDEAPDRFALAGLSMGGYCALEIMRQAPQRVTRLALLNTSARPDGEEQFARRRGLIALAQMGKFKGVTPRLLPLLLHPSRLQEEALTSTVMRMSERVGKEAFLRQQKAIMGRPDSRPGLARIACPTLVVAGRQDGLIPLEVLQEMAGLIRGARLEEIDECGHLSTLERPERVNAAFCGWLAR